MIFALLSLFLSLNAAQAAPSSGGQNGASLIVNFPRVYTLNYDKLPGGTSWSYGGGVGFVPALTISGTSVSTFNVSTAGRWHPFSGGFFLGIGLAYQSISGSASKNVDVSGTSVPMKGEASLGNFSITPHFGWIYNIGKALIGLELGTQSSLSTSSTVNLTITDASLQSLATQVQSTTAYQDLKSGVEKGINAIGGMNLPYIALRLGWMF